MEAAATVALPVEPTARVAFQVATAALHMEATAAFVLLLEPTARVALHVEALHVGATAFVGLQRKATALVEFHMEPAKGPALPIEQTARLTLQMELHALQHLNVLQFLGGMCLLIAHTQVETNRAAALDEIASSGQHETPSDDLGVDGAYSSPPRCRCGECSALTVASAANCRTGK